MWRRVPCQHQLNMGESGLSPRINFLLPTCSQASKRTVDTKLAVDRDRLSVAVVGSGGGVGFFDPCCCCCCGRHDVQSEGRTTTTNSSMYVRQNALSWKGCSGEREYGNDSVTCVRTGPVSFYTGEVGSSV